MKNYRFLLAVTAIVAVLFTGSIAYGFFNEQDPYHSHTGLGASISVSHNDEFIVFSYYEDGQEAIHKASLKDGRVEKITEPTNEDQRMPKLSASDKELLYLSAGQKGVQSLRYINNLSEGKSVQLTDAEVHVTDAVFSPDGRTIYYIATPTEDYLKSEGEKENGADLYSVVIEGEEAIKLTDRNYSAMDKLTISAEGDTLYYSEFDGAQRLMSYSIEEGTDSAYLQEYFKSDLYQPTFSSDGQSVAYTAVSEETNRSGPTFEYELFLMETSTGEATRLTEFNASVTSPAFFHNEDKIAFLAQPNWPNEPAVYEIMTVDYKTGEAAPLQMELTESSSLLQFTDLLNWFANPLTTAFFYLLLFSLLAVYFHLALNKGYLPVIVSAILTAVCLACSFAAALFDPWFAIGLFTLAVQLAVCTIIILFFFVIYRGLLNIFKNKRSKSIDR